MKLTRNLQQRHDNITANFIIEKMLSNSVTKLVSKPKFQIGHSYAEWLIRKGTHIKKISLNRGINTATC